MGSGITLSKKHGLNPSVCHCPICGKETGVALLGRLKDDAQAPRDIMGTEYCDTCKSVIDKGGIMVIEIRDNSQQHPYRTGRIVGLNKEWKEANHIEANAAYMEEHIFKEVFKNITFNNETDRK